MQANIPLRIAGAIGVAAALALGACANSNTNNDRASYPGANNTSVSATQYGVVQSIELVRLEGTGGSGIGAGTIIGAVVGGVVGNQVGRGLGNTAATVIGAAGGAYAGNQIEKRNQHGTDAFRITVQMGDGSYQTVTQTSDDQLRVGDRVQVANGAARRY